MERSQSPALIYINIYTFTKRMQRGNAPAQEATIESDKSQACATSVQPHIEGLKGAHEHQRNNCGAECETAAARRSCVCACCVTHAGVTVSMWRGEMKHSTQVRRCILKFLPGVCCTSHRSRHWNKSVGNSAVTLSTERIGRLACVWVCRRLAFAAVFRILSFSPACGSAPVS